MSQGPSPGAPEGAVAIVTDSTAALPPGDVTLDIYTVPVLVLLDGQQYREGEQIGPREVAEALREHKMLSTSRPAPEAFRQLYAELAERGHSGIVSINLSGALSSTVESAQIAARQCSVPIAVVDSRSVAMGAGYGVLDAYAAAARGLDVGAVADVARSTAAATKILFYVDTLEYLQRGGRIGKAQRWVGQALGVKPILHLEDGQVAPLEKVRTRNKALARLVELVVAAVREQPGARVAVHHLDSPDRAEMVSRRISEQTGPRPVICHLGAVIAAHTGPGIVAVAVAPPAPEQ